MAIDLMSQHPGPHYTMGFCHFKMIKKILIIFIHQSVRTKPGKNEVGAQYL
jgi:hypothetical protein